MRQHPQYRFTVLGIRWVLMLLRLPQLSSATGYLAEGTFAVALEVNDPLIPEEGQTFQVAL